MVSIVVYPDHDKILIEVLFLNIVTLRIYSSQNSIILLRENSYIRIGNILVFLSFLFLEFLLVVLTVKW